MKSINSSKKISIICYCVSVLIFLAIALLGVFFPESSYFLTCFYTVMPLTTLITSFIISIKKGYLFWFYSVFVGFWGILIPFLLTNTFYMLDLFLAFFPALIGLIIGLIIRFIIKKYEIK